jgi:hypothetical protein
MRDAENMCKERDDDGARQTEEGLSHLQRAKEAGYVPIVLKRVDV